MKPNEARQRSTKLADFSMLCLWLMSCIGMAAFSLIQYGEDFQGYYAAARVLLSGGNPYDFKVVAAVLEQVTGTISNHPFYYPLWFGWFMVPFAALPYELARGIWMAINLLLWIFAVISLSQLLQWPPHGWQQHIMALVATILFAWMTWRYEQVGILLLALLLATLKAIRSRKWLLSGFLMTLLLIKPTVTIFVVGAVLLWLLRKGYFQPLIAVFATFAGLTAITTIFTPSWYLPWFDSGFSGGLYGVMQPSGQLEAVRINTTMVDWLATFISEKSWLVMIYGVVSTILLALLITVALRSKSLMPVIIVSVLVSFLITPYALQYDFPMLTIVLYWSAALFIHSKHGALVSLLLIAFILSVLFWERPISDAYWIVLGLAALAAWNWKNSSSATLPDSLLWNARGLQPIASTNQESAIA